MALFPLGKLLLKTTTCYATRHGPVRSLMSKQLVYHQFGDPLTVVKIREAAVPELGDLQVLVRMLAAPVNPADINTIQGSYPKLPRLPHVPGDEGVGNIVQVGSKVTYVEPGQRVVLSSRQLGSWSYYGIYNEKDVHKIPSNIPLAEACMLTISPVSAYRMLYDFREEELRPGQTIIQNGANSAIGQCVIQLCKAWGIKTMNIVSNHRGYERMRDHLYRIGATEVFTLEEAQKLASCGLSFQRPTLAINCVGKTYEDVMLMLLELNGNIVYYGDAYGHPLKQYMRPDVKFHRFNLSAWDDTASSVEKDKTYKRLQELIVMGKFRAPRYKPLLLKNYVYALKNTCRHESICALNYVFDFTLI